MILQHWCVCVCLNSYNVQLYTTLVPYHIVFYSSDIYCFITLEPCNLHSYSYQAQRQLESHGVMNLTQKETSLLIRF